MHVKSVHNNYKTSNTSSNIENYHHLNAVKCPYDFRTKSVYEINWFVCTLHDIIQNRCITSLIILFRFCGRENPQVELISETNQMLIIFKSPGETSDTQARLGMKFVYTLGMSYGIVSLQFG